MKIKFDTALKDVDGNDMVEAPGIFTTLKKVAIASLNWFDPTYRIENPTPDEKYKRFELALKINGKADKNGEIDITPEEATLAKQCIGRAYGPTVVGPAWQLLNGK